MENIATQARALAAVAHKNQSYGRDGDAPYTRHLDEVVQILVIAGIKDPEALAVGYLHDIIEDTDITAEDLKAQGFPEKVISGVLFCTDEPGQNRRSRKEATARKVRAFILSDYEGVHHGLPAKWADRIANIQACVRDQDRRIDMYRKERYSFRDTYWDQNVPPILVDMYDDIWKADQ